MSKKIEARVPEQKYLQKFTNKLLKNPPFRWALLKDFTSDGFRNTVPL